MGSRVLVVDDSEDVRIVLRKTLQNAGYEVVEATDGDELVGAALEHAPLDAVLLDIAMPRMDGFTALKALKQEPRTRHIPVIMVTAKGQAADLDVARSLGAHDYINKPWAKGEVELRVQWTINAARQWREKEAG